MTSRQPRLAYICADRGIAPDGTKGASVHFRQMGRALAAAGVDLEAFAMKLRDPDAVGFRVEVIGHRSKGKGLDAEVRMLASSGALLERLEKRGPFDAVYERFSLFAPAGLAYARSQGVPFILEVNAPLWIEAEKYRSLELKETARALARETLQGADRVLTVSPRLKEIVCAEGVRPEKIDLFPNGVADRFFTDPPCARPEALEGRPVIVFCGSLKPWHGVSFLLEAFEKLAARRAVGLWIVGDGPLRDEIEQAQQRFPGQIHWEGAVPHERLPAILKAADMAAAPYPASAPDYFCPLKVIEALAAGCPVLASDSAMMRSWVGDPPRAALFAAESVDGFASAAESILDNDEKRRTMITEGGRIARSRYTWRRRIEELFGILEWTPQTPSASSKGVR